MSDHTEAAALPVPADFPQYESPVERQEQYLAFVRMEKTLSLKFCDGDTWEARERDLMVALELFATVIELGQEHMERL